jgi:hypothetical protein
LSHDEPKEVPMTFDPDRRAGLDDPIRRRMLDGEGSGWAPVLVGVLLLLGFAYLIFGNWGPAPEQGTRESRVQIDRTAPPAPTPKAPN